MDPLRIKVFPKGRKSHALRLSVHLDNCRVPSSKASEQFLDDNSLVIVLHPPSSSDLTPSDFWLFGQIWASLTGPIFNDIDELPELVSKFLNEIQPTELQLVFTTGPNE
jgi:hypothetical protein